MKKNDLVVQQITYIIPIGQRHIYAADKQAFGFSAWQQKPL